ncbi:hypothetical protein [Mediterranea sp. An20]|nr:hypothetical protein [Mediterranea sp. An20]
MKTEREILKENVLIDIDEFMDSQFDKPGHRNVKDFVKKLVLM